MHPILYNIAKSFEEAFSIYKNNVQIRRNQTRKPMTWWMRLCILLIQGSPWESTLTSWSTLCGLHSGYTSTEKTQQKTCSIITFRCTITQSFTANLLIIIYNTIIMLYNMVVKEHTPVLAFVPTSALPNGRRHCWGAKRRAKRTC